MKFELLTGAGGVNLQLSAPVQMRVQMTAPAGLRGPRGPTGSDGWAVPIQKVIAPGGAIVLDYRDGKTVDLVIEGDTSIAFEPDGWPLPVDEQAFLARFTLQIYNPGHYLISFPDDVWWTSGAPVTVPGLSMLAFSTIDGGVTLLGHIIGTNYLRGA